MRLLRFGLRVGHMGGHGTLTLATMPGVKYLVAEFTALGVALFSCHNDNDNDKVGKYCLRSGKGFPYRCQAVVSP